METDKPLWNMDQLGNVLQGCAGLLDNIKAEWGQEWSELDQSVRDGITAQLRKLEAKSAECGNDFVPKKLPYVPYIDPNEWPGLLRKLHERPGVIEPVTEPVEPPSPVAWNMLGWAKYDDGGFPHFCDVEDEGAFRVYVVNQRGVTTNDK